MKTLKFKKMPFGYLIYKSLCPTKFEPPKPKGISYLEREREEGGWEVSRTAGSQI